MRRLPVVILVMVALLVAMLTGCGAHRYDGRLVAADSLMRNDPDSALALLEDLPTASLTTDGDRAYHGLLLAQARYKAYVVATSDSDINRALSYYRAHSGEREKLTRAYIYKGAVMEELGHPDSAMYYYKSAEATADEKDYVNLGQVNTRIADLYRRYYGNEEICFDKYKRALYFHTVTGNKHLQQNCLYNMAVCLSISNTRDPKNYLAQALDLALELNDSVNVYFCLERLCRQLSLREHRFTEAKKIAFICLTKYRKYIGNELILDLSHIYANTKMPDSARFYLGLIDNTLLNRNPQDRINRYVALSTISEAEEDTVMRNYYNNLQNQLADSIDNTTEKNYIQLIENSKNNEIASSNSIRIKNLKCLSILLALFSFLFITGVMIYHYHKISHIRSITKELSSQKRVDQHEDLILQLNTTDSRLQHFVKNMVDFIQTAINTSENDPPVIVRRRLKETIENLTTDDFWNELKTYLDNNYNNIISNIAKNPKISEVDLRFIGLCCLGFNYIEIAITLKVSPNYISTKRKAIARKLGLKIPLQDYLEKEMRNREKA